MNKRCTYCWTVHARTVQCCSDACTKALARCKTPDPLLTRSEVKRLLSGKRLAVTV
jgi:hypothetical protein